MSTLHIDVERVHDILDDEGSRASEHRVLVDRLWPRGIAKDRLDYDDWDKDAAPSSELRTSFHSGELDFEEFSGRYRRELDGGDAVGALLERARKAGASRITLLFAAKDTEHNHAQVLKAALEDAQD